MITATKEDKPILGYLEATLKEDGLYLKTEGEILITFANDYIQIANLNKNVTILGANTLSSNNKL